MAGFPLVRGLLAATLALGACTNSPTGPANPSATRPTVVAVSPANGTIAADPTKPVMVTFSYQMMTGMEMLVVLHEGTVTGPQVAGSSVWSSDRTVLTFTPSAALKARTTYSLHLSPNLQGANGQMINMTAGGMMGGQFVTGGMMGSGGMMNGQWGPGMTGAGWQASNGTFGMFFTFTTA